MKCCLWLLVRDNCREEPLSLVTQEIWCFLIGHQKPEFHLTRRTYVPRELEGKVLSNILCIYSMTLRYQQLLAIVIYLVIPRADLVPLYVLPKPTHVLPKSLCSTKTTPCILPKYLCSTKTTPCIVPKHLVYHQSICKVHYLGLTLQSLVEPILVL